MKDEHRKVARKKYGLESIPKGFIVHHLDINKKNNDPKNLILLHRKDHARLHFGHIVLKRIKKEK